MRNFTNIKSRTSTLQFSLRMRSMMKYFWARYHTNIYTSLFKYLYLQVFFFLHMILKDDVWNINIKYCKYLYLCVEVFIPMMLTIFARERLSHRRLRNIDAGIWSPHYSIRGRLMWGRLSPSWFFLSRWSVTLHD